MPEQDGNIPGVPCWVDTSQPDPEAAVPFYSARFLSGFGSEPPRGAGSPPLSASLIGGHGR